MKSLVYFVNTIPEYRYKVYRKLAEIYDVTYIVDNLELGVEIYNGNIYTDCLNVLPFTKKNLTDIREYCSSADYIILQPPDGLHDIYRSWQQFLLSHRFKSKIFIFWERWSLPIPRKYILKRFKSMVHDCMVKPLIHRVDGLLVPGIVSYDYMKYLNVESGNIHIVGNASELPESKDINVRCEYGVPENSFLFLSLCRLIPRKGVDILIDAFICMLDKFDNAYLMIAGSGPCLEQLKSQASSFLERIIFVGFVPQSLRTDFFRACDGFILPSCFYHGIAEAWGLTLNEAMSCGKPIISTSAVGASYDLINNDTGIMVEEGNVEALAEAMYKLCRSSYSCKTIIDNANMYTVDAVCNNIERVLDGYDK